MEYKLMHWAYHPNKGGKGVPASRPVSDLGDMEEDYIGTFSQDNPIKIVGNSVLVVRKSVNSEPKKAFRLRGAEIGTLNGRMPLLSKDVLFKIAKAMDSTDLLSVMDLNYSDTKELDNIRLGIKEVTG